MSERLRAEDVKEALEKWAWLNENGTERQAFEWALENDPLVITRIWAAARLWLASQEQTPDYQAAEKVYAEHRPGVGPVTDRKRVKAIVDAALVGFHPQPEGDER